MLFIETSSVLGGVQDSVDTELSKKGKTSALLKHFLLGTDGKSIHELMNKITADGDKCYQEQERSQGVRAKGS